MLNNGMNTSSKGLTVEGARITGLNVANGSPCTIAEDCKAGLIGSVIHTAIGIYTVQLTIPFPPKVVNIVPKLSCALATSPVLTARYQNGSYNPTTGTFVIFVSTTAAAAADGGAADELHLDMKFNRYTR